MSYGQWHSQEFPIDGGGEEIYRKICRAIGAHPSSFL